MTSPYEIEISEPATSRCDCCEALSVSLTGFVSRAGEAFAIYYAAYTNHAASDEVRVLVSIGEWGDDSVASDRSAFYCRVRQSDDSYEVMLADAATSPWGAVELVGTKLTRDEARMHPWKAAAFEVLDEAFVQERSLRGFLQRARCGDVSAPLEKSYQAPDDIFALGEHEASRACAGRNFAVLDGQRHFVRCLLQLPVEDYGAWCVGLWVEVAKVDHDRLMDAWDDPVAYRRIELTGHVANDVRSELGLPVSVGDEVVVHVPDSDAPPHVKGAVAPDAELNALRSSSWAKTDFERWAVSQGFL